MLLSLVDMMMSVMAAGIVLPMKLTTTITMPTTPTTTIALQAQNSIADVGGGGGNDAIDIDGSDACNVFFFIRWPERCRCRLAMAWR